MKRTILLASFAWLAFAQTPVGPDEVVITADSQVAEGPLRHLSGHVVIETDKMLLKADQADYNEDTLEITAHGHATVKLKKRDLQTPRPEQQH